jgi:hypothetical protein
MDPFKLLIQLSQLAEEQYTSAGQLTEFVEGE